MLRVKKKYRGKATRSGPGKGRLRRLRRHLYEGYQRGKRESESWVAEEKKKNSWLRGERVVKNSRRDKGEGKGGGAQRPCLWENQANTGKRGDERQPISAIRSRDTS